MDEERKNEKQDHLPEKRSVKKAPRLILRRERLMKDYDVVTITNRRLSVHNFIHKGQKYKYYFKYNFEQTHGSIMLKFLGDSFEKSLKSAKGLIKPLREGESVPNKIEVQGNEECFSICFTIRNAKLPLCYEGTIGQLEFKIQCYGTIRLSKPSKKSNLTKGLIGIGPTGLRSSSVPPESVVWSVMRPYSGGSVTPR